MLLNDSLGHLNTGVYKVPHSPPPQVYKVCWGRISSCEKRKGKSWLREEYREKKRKRGSNIIVAIILGLLGRISTGEEGEGT